MGGSQRSAVHDPRAYPQDSGRISFETGLDRAGILLPGCMQDHLRYALVDDGFGCYYRVYLRIDSSADCMNTFLIHNDLVNIRQTSLLGDVSDE